MLREKKEKDDVKKKKTEEGKKDGGGKTPTKRIAEPSDDSDIESTYIIEIDFSLILSGKTTSCTTHLLFLCIITQYNRSKYFQNLSD